MKLAKMGQFVVEREVCVAGARIGNFKFKTAEDAIAYPTPLFFIHTLSGSVPHITREVFDIIFPPVSNKLPPPIQISIDSTFPFCDVVGPSNKDISTFVGLGHCPCVLTVHNPLSELKSGFNDTKGISIWPRYGRRTLDDQKFAKIVSDFKPSLFQALSDYDVNSLTLNKRFRKSTTRTVNSLEECVKVKNNESNSSLLFATIETAWFTINETEANRTIGEMMEKSNDITGFVLGGLSLPLAITEIKKKSKNGSEEIEKICPEINKTEVLSKIIPKLPKDKPRYVPGPLNPEEIIDLVVMGIDMFDSSIITRMADDGEVFLFNLEKYIVDGKNGPAQTFNEGLAGADAPGEVSSLLKLKDKM